MNTSLNSSNSDEDGILGGQSLALSASENEENSKDEFNIRSKSEKYISNNYNEKDSTILEVINPIISEENNSKCRTNQCLNEQSDFNLNNQNVDPKTCNNKKTYDKLNTIDSENLKIGINEDSNQGEIDSNNLEKLNSNSDNEHTFSKKRVKCISYSEDDEDFIDKQISTNYLAKKQKDIQISDIIDSESVEEIQLSKEQDRTISNNETNHKKISTIIDTESEEDGEQEELQSNDELNHNNFNSEEYTKTQIANNKHQRQERAAAKVELDAISAIKSETQRMHRENEINVPYHKPRNCTLKEFMARKSQDVLKNAVNKSNNKGLSLKMTEEELENYANYLEKREKESQELFANEEELVFPIDTRTVKEKNESYKPMYTVNNDSTQNELENSSKIEIISNILIAPPITTETPATATTSTMNISNLKKLLEEGKNLIASPILKGDSKFIIDLESGDMIPSTLETPKSGVDKLFERFLKSSGSKKLINTTKNSSTITDNGLNNHSCNNSLIDDNKKDRKPGASYIALKNNLRKIIFESRKTVLEKKINDYKIENKMVEQICAEEDDYESDYDEDIEKDNYEIEDNLKDEDTDTIEKDNYEIGDNLKEEDTDKIEKEVTNDSDEADDESDESIEMDGRRNKKLSRRVIKRFEEDGDSDSQEYNFLNNSPKQSNEIEINEKQEEELLELCSGKFESTQIQSEIKTIAFIVPTTQLATQFNESQLEALCSGTFTNSIKEIPKNSIISNDDEEDDELLEKVHTKKIANKISYSDDEDEVKEQDYNINNFNEHIELKKLDNFSDENEEEEEAEQLETYIDYDSDENEIKVEMTKADRKIRATDFVEKEAELSESEWGSADEDEKDLDRYDIELGDEDEFDQEKLHSELGKIHMRKMLDEDAREVKKMQELLFDDEENDGLGRQRQFRWRKTETGFDINENADGDQENKESGDDEEENEEQWRKMKHEREVILMEKQKTGEESNKIILSPLKLNNSNQIDKMNLGADSTKILINKSKKSIDLKNIECDLPFLISKNSCGGIRGSFLKRDKEILSKVAASLISSREININTDSNDDIGRVKTTTGKHNNFVFTILSQPNIQKTNKRKLSDISVIDTNKSIKKTKLISNQLKKNLIDHLDLTEC